MVWMALVIEDRKKRFVATTFRRQPSVFGFDVDDGAVMALGCNF
jgi:hypothetical protein